jgi:hypothetical protein
MAALAITGALQMTPSDFVNAHAGILPIELALLKACHSALVRTFTLPSTNSVWQIFKRAKHVQPQKHPGPIDKLLKLYALEDTKIETIYPAIVLKSLSPRRTIIKDKSREESINSEHIDNADYKIFSDGSGHDDGIGASAVLYENRRSCPLKTLQVHMGSPDKHNTYKAEAMGAILAL